jgi:nitroreductase
MPQGNPTLQPIDPAATLSKALNWRYAVRAFSGATLTDAQIQPLLEALSLSPSSYGLQPYRALLLKDRALRQQLVPHAMGQEKVADCSHLLVLAAQTCIGDHTVDQYAQHANRVREEPIPQGMLDHMKTALAGMSTAEQQQWAHQQACVALGNLLTSAALLGVDACPIGGINPKGIDQVLGLADLGLTTTVLIALGVRDHGDALAQQPKVRLGVDELVVGRE